MPEQIPQEFVVPDRDELIEDYKRDVRFHSNGAYATDEGSLADLDARVLADQLGPLYQQGARSADNLVLRKSTGHAAEEWAISKGLEGRIKARGSSGFALVTAATGGTTLQEGDPLKELASGLRFECAQGGTYTSATPVPIRAIDTGPGTNLPAGTVLVWGAPRPGCGDQATVWATADGEGLSGGRLEETDAEIIDRVIDAGANPPATGNAAHVQKLVRETPGLAVQAVFTYEGINGPGSVAVVFTMQPTTDGGSRVPNDAQLAQVEAWLSQQLGDNDSLFVCFLQESAVDVTIRVAWLGEGWTDSAPWPPYYAGTNAVTVQSAADATHFVLRRQTGGYVGVPQPQVGQTICFYSAAARTFHAKRILSVTGAGPWTIVVDTTNNASDTTFVPAVGQAVLPHSKSLPLVVGALLAEFKKYGPGEQVASFFDAGRRQRRSPAPPKSWPSVVGYRLINGVQDLPSVADAELLSPATPHPTPVGSPAVRSYLLALGDVRVYSLPAS